MSERVRVLLADDEAFTHMWRHVDALRGRFDLEVADTLWDAVGLFEKKGGASYAPDVALVDMRWKGEVPGTLLDIAREESLDIGEFTGHALAVLIRRKAPQAKVMLISNFPQRGGDQSAGFDFMNKNDDQLSPEGIADYVEGLAR